MARTKAHDFSGPVSALHERSLPEVATPAGYAALIEAFKLRVPVPSRLMATAAKHKTLLKDGWHILTPRHAPRPTLDGHLTFALKYEGVDLAVLKRLFQATGPTQIEAWVRRAPTSSYARRIWFLYEWLLGTQLDLPDLKKKIRYVDALNPEQQWAGAPANVPRYLVRNNLPGTPAFCPLVTRTETLENFISLGLGQRAKDIMAKVSADIMARTAAFLLLQDSRASYVIEGENPPQDRIQRWGRAIGQAGSKPVSLDELLRLQAIVIGDARFVHMGLRTTGGFIGEHDRQTRVPIPVHISARHEDLIGLVNGIIAFDSERAQHLDAVIAAAVLAFGFVYIHPFEDGNGRLHRYLIHHALAARDFNPPGLVFPVSAAILSRIDDYRKVLETYSQRVLPLIEWQPTEQGNIEVLNETADFYRYFDATPHAEFLYACVQQTIESDLPEGIDYLRRYDAFRARIKAIIDMPDRTTDLLFRFLRQNHGKLSARARGEEFVKLEAGEIERVEAAYAATFVAP